MAAFLYTCLLYTSTIEDTGIVLGTAIKEAIGDKKGIRRYGSCILPMDEVLVLCAIDLSGRPYFSWDAEFTSCLLYTSTDTVQSGKRHFAQH